VHAADDHHVVRAAEHATFEIDEPVGSRALPAWPHEIAAAVAQNRTANASEIREDKLRELSLGSMFAGFDGEKFGDELAFHHVQTAASGVAVAPGAHFRGSAVIDHAGIPGALDPRACFAHGAT